MQIISSVLVKWRHFNRLLIIFYLSLFWGCITGPKIPKNVKEKYTLMIYMVGSDLESLYGAATDDMKEMMEIGSTKNLNIIVTTGGASVWQQKDINPHKIQRWYIERGKKRLLEDTTDFNMANKDNLANFIQYSVKNFPADKYGIILWDHGGGSINGFGLDEHTGRMMRVDQVRDAFADAYSKTNVKFELIGFDSCLMATLETANVLAPYGEILVASEETEPGHGWDYHKIIWEIAENPRVNGLRLGRRIAQSYEKHAYRNLTFKDITLSVLRLNKVAPAIKALDELIVQAEKNIKAPRQIQKIQFARSKAEDYGNSPEGATDMVDLMDLAYQLQSEYPKPSKKLIDALREIISFRVRGSGKPAANGVSIYFPHRTIKDAFFTLDRFQKLKFSSTYEKFLKQYTRKIEKDKIPIRYESAPVAGVAKTADRQTFSISLNPADSQQLDRAYSVLAVAGSKKNPAVKFFMGLDDSVTIGKNRLSYEWKKSWLTLNGEFIAMYLLNRHKKAEGNGIVKTYGAPILLNGKKMHLVIHYDSDEDEYEVLGARRGPDKKTGVFPRELIQPGKGDKITLRWRYHNPKTNKIGFRSGRTFPVNDELKIVPKSLKQTGGKFFLGFMTIDFAQNQSISEFIALP